ncbi:hypothetical protein IW492_14120 [Enterococcus sp. BWB1-3]|uniref:hypothetical protein n=1 Tax=Enterococcus sp. BWB1-3 TaxID=2787713 RepID=UPI001924FD3E|nr:hypothetical protein [Enterococcus sp. BWB1-3]MBL1230369.1 hypothetical protein [Enterococcus sp. BWB1-3]
MDEWKQIKIEGIAKIEKCVGEFEISEYYISPWQTFKIKVYESQSGMYTGVSNLQIKDGDGDFSVFVGNGKTISDALEKTIQCFFERTSRKPKEEWNMEDFKSSDPYDF